MLYDTLSEYQKRDVMRIAVTFDDGARLFAEGVNGGTFIVDRNGRAAYFERGLNEALQKTDKVGVTEGGRTLVVARSDGSLVLVDVASGAPINDFAFLAGAVTEVWVHPSDEMVLVHRAGERYSWLDLRAGRRIDFAWRNRVREWDLGYPSEGSTLLARLVLLGEDGELATVSAGSATATMLARDITTLSVDAGLLMVQGATGAAAWDLAGPNLVHQATSEEQLVATRGEAVVVSRAGITFADQIQRTVPKHVWTLAGVAGYVSTDGTGTALRTRAWSVDLQGETFAIAESGARIALLQGARLVDLDADTGETIQRVDLPAVFGEPELRLVSGTAFVRAGGNLTVHRVGQQGVRTVQVPETA